MSRIVALKKSLNLVQQDTKTIVEYLQMVKTIVDKVTLAQALINDEDIVITILNGLNEDFNQISTTHQARETLITYEELFEKLFGFERQLKKIEIVVVPTMTAIVAYHGKQSSDNNRSSSFNRQGRNFNTNQTYRGNNFNRNSNFQNRGRTQGEACSNGNKPNCQLSGKYGHTADVCQNYNIA